MSCLISTLCFLAIHWSIRTYFGKQPEKSCKQVEVDGCKPSFQVKPSRHLSLSLQLGAITKEQHATVGHFPNAIRRHI
jgi:hypothetical protein